MQSIQDKKYALCMTIASMSLSLTEHYPPIVVQDKSLRTFRPQPSPQHHLHLLTDPCLKITQETVILASCELALPCDDPLNHFIQGILPVSDHPLVILQHILILVLLSDSKSLV